MAFTSLKFEQDVVKGSWCDDDSISVCPRQASVLPFILWEPWWTSPEHVCVGRSQSCSTLFDPMNCRPDSVHGILQSRILGSRSLLQGIPWKDTHNSALILHLGLCFLCIRNHHKWPFSMPKWTSTLSRLHLFRRLVSKIRLVRRQVSTVIYTSIVLCSKCWLLSYVRLFATLWTVARQDPLSMGFSWQEYWSGLPFPSPTDLPYPGIEPMSPTLQADSLQPEPSGKTFYAIKFTSINEVIVSAM